jgi:hypothetical protein
MHLESALDRLHARVVASPWLRLFEAATRGLLAMGFIIPGAKKFEGRFTTLPLSDPVGFFFEAMYRAHGFYLFVGAEQVLAGILLLFRLTAPLGAVLYFPVILGIFVINVSVGFTGTYYITALMTLATAFVLCWDYDRWKSLLPGFGRTAAYDPARRLGTATTLAAGLTVALTGYGTAATGLHVVEHRARELAFSLPVLAVGVASAAWLLIRYRRTGAPA